MNVVCRAARPSTDAPSVLSACTCCVPQDRAGLRQAVVVRCFLGAALWRECSPQVQSDTVQRAPTPHLYVSMTLLCRPPVVVGTERCVCLHHVVKMTLFFFLNSDPKLEAQRQRLSSVVAADLLPSLEGLELGSYGKVNVYHMLRNRNAPVRQTCLNDVVFLFRRCPMLSFSIRLMPW